MANLSFLSTLTEQQRQYAEIIRERAQAMGIPPDLAVAVAFQESRLNPATPTNRMGAVGIMQVRPIAARDVGVDPEKLQDPDANIDAGLRYLKKALTETGDPRLAVIYYNAGPQRLIEFDRGGDLPKETQDYLLALKGYGAFRAEPPAEPASEPSLNRPEPPSAPVMGRNEPVMSPEPATEDPFKLPDMQTAINAQERRMAELVGLGGGAALAAGRAGSDVATKGLQAAGQAVARGVGQAGPPAGPGGAPAGLPGAPVSGPGAPGMTPPGGAPLTPGGTRPPPFAAQPGAPGAFPRAAGPGQGVVNTGRAFGLTPIEAQLATGMTKQEGGVWDLINKAQEGRGRVAQMGGGFVENPMFGGIMTPEQSAGRGPRASYVSTPGGLQSIPTPSPVPTVPPKPGGLEQVTQAFRRMADTGLGLAGRAMRYVAPPLAGAQGAGELASAYQESRKEQPDPVTMALRTAGGLGALASAFPATAPVGLPVAIGAPLVQSMREDPSLVTDPLQTIGSSALGNVSPATATVGMPNAVTASLMQAIRNRIGAQPPSPLTEAESEMASRPAVFYRTGTRWPAAVLEQRRQAR
jgi:hypothetical protein